jgi:hypothetical protein
VSKVDLAAVMALLEAIQAEDKTQSSAAWLIDGSASVDALTQEEALVAVEAARRMALVGALNEAKGASDKLTRKAAARALHSLRSSGHEVPEQPKAAAGWSMGTEVREIPAPVGLIGLPQGDGYFPYIMVAYGKDNACVCAGVAGAGQGYQDADHAHVSRSKARDIIDNARRDHNLVEVPFHVALHFAERAFTEGGAGQPHGWHHMLSSVDEGLKNAARMLNPLQGQETELDSAALHDMEALLEGPHRIVFNLEERISGPAVDEVMGALTSQIAINDDEKRKRVADQVVTATNTAFDGHARATWTLAMDVLASIAKIAEWEPERRAARQVSLALAAGRPGVDILFFRVWTERQLAAVSEMIMSVRADREQSTQ